jgi:hypothetical protein
MNIVKYVIPHVIFNITCAVTMGHNSTALLPLCRCENKATENTHKNKTKTKIK